MPKSVVEVTPSARRLTASLRDVGYDLATAMADIVDNSISAGARTVDIETVFDGVNSHIIIADDGSGMSGSQLDEALRFGSRRSYASGELGRYGLGLKTASLSQCRRLTVVTRQSPIRCRASIRTLDLDHIDETDRWELIDPPTDTNAYRALEWIENGPGTVVVWELLDRILPANRPESGWGRRRITQAAATISEYLSMVFHRFLERDDPVVITVNGEKLKAWNPFAPGEEETVELPAIRFDVPTGSGGSSEVLLRRFLLPTRARFSSAEEFERLGGPNRWNRQQGLYVYRADRLIQSGGWVGIRGVDEHTKLARAALDFDTDLDEQFRINVAKMRVALPPEIKPLLEPPVHELCQRANDRYRRDTAHPQPNRDARKDPTSTRTTTDLADVGAELMSAALAAGQAEAIEAIMDQLAEARPDLAKSLGW